MTNRSKKFVWVVIHCEYVARGPGLDDDLLPFTDEMVFHVASTRRAAEKYVRVLHVSTHSWWKVEKRLVNQPDYDADDRPERHFYNYRGKPRSKEPRSAALPQFQKWQLELAKRG